MGGGDLNTKKSWHPKTGKNQERVWKAEQINAAEKKKVADLQKEIQEERTREELTNIAKKSGYIDDDKKGKLEWMYKGCSDMLNREEYLTGRAIDKNFETLSAIEANPAISVPKNHVESDIIPYSIREYSKLENKKYLNSEQVDMQRKLVEDPLMAIQQKEIEMRRKILENPVKLKELHRLLKIEKDQNPPEKEKSKKSSNKKSKKKRKQRNSSSHSAASSDDDRNLDELLVKKIKGMKGNEEDSDNEANLDKVLAMKYNAIAKELDEMAKKKRKKKRKSDRSSDRSLEPDRKSKQFASEKRARTGSKDRGKTRKESLSRDNRDVRRTSPSRDNRDVRRTSPSRDNRDVKRSRSRNNRNMRKYERFNDDRKNTRYRNTPENFGNVRNDRNFMNRRPDSINRNPRDKRRSRDRDNRRSPFRRNRSARRSPSQDKEVTKRSRSRDNKYYKRKHESRERSNEKIQKRSRSPPSRSSSSSSDSFTPKRIDQDSDEEKRQKKRFGLVTAGGKKIALDRTEKVKLYNKTELKAAKEAIKPTWTRVERKTLTEEEIEQKRKEMADNSKWREQDRAVAVKRYREEDSEKVDKEYDKDFLNKQMKKAQTTISSVESRIKSNLTNIQRSSRVMDTHFARR